jgi:hypothetical protein
MPYPVMVGFTAGVAIAAKPIDLFMEEASKIGGRVLDASFSNPFIPKLWTVLHEDYGKACRRTPRR